MLLLSECGIETFVLGWLITEESSVDKIIRFTSPRILGLVIARAFPISSTKTQKPQIRLSKRLMGGPFRAVCYTSFRQLGRGRLA